MKNNIFEDIGFSEKEAKMLEIKSDLMIEIERLVKRHNLSRRSLEQILDVPQPRVSELMTGKIDKMSIDKLINYLITLCYKIGEKPKFKIETEKVA